MAMVEEQVMPQALVLDGNREKLAKRIDSVKLALRDELIDRQKTAFCKLFMNSCNRYFGFRSSDLIRIENNEELLTLELEVFKKAERGYKLTKYVAMPLMALIPIFGWGVISMTCAGNFVGVDGFDTFHYCKLRRILTETYGKEFFPFETLKQIL